MSELQDLVEALAMRIDRSVAIDDQRFRLAVFSSHRQDTDDVRRASILCRQAPEDAARWMVQRGVSKATHPLHIEEVPRLGMRARVCIPIRFDGFLLGYMWVIEDTTKLTEDDLAECVEAAGDAAPLMYRERLLDDHMRERERQCVVDLLDSSGRRRGAAAQAALEEGLLAASGAYGVIALERALPARRARGGARRRRAGGARAGPAHGAAARVPDRQPRLARGADRRASRGR